MADVLSQDEIDSLLSALSSGEIDAETIKQEESRVQRYDFKRPNKFSKDQMRTLQMLHEHFARMMTTTLSGQLRSFVNIDVASVDQLTYEEFIRSISSPAIITIFDMSPLEGSAIMEFDPEIGFVIIDLLFGGIGDRLEIDREITDIEETVIARMLNKILDDYQETWSDVNEIKPRLQEIETNPQFTQLVPESDIVLLITFEVRIKDTDGLFNICIPHLVLEPVLDRLSAHHWFSGVREKSSGEDLSQIRERILKARVPLSAELGKSTLLVEEFLELKPGDVIRLNTRIDEEVQIRVGRRVKFGGYPGIQNKQRAVKIESVYDEPGEDGEPGNG